MNRKTCLLVTDDPDDHLAFTEAISEISSEITVLIVLDLETALPLIESHQCHSDYIFVDLSKPEIPINSFLETLRNQPRTAERTIFVYADERNLSVIEQAKDLIFFKKNYRYAHLRDFLRELI